jgi:hypothetical protein
VVIHRSHGAERRLECFIHLDDVGFLAAKSLFSSAGAVRFLSRRAQLTGTGMELIYDESCSRLELFRIFQLDSLRLSSRELGSVADLTPRRSPSDAPSAADASARPAPAETGPDPALGDRYQCIFHNNVTISRRNVWSRRGTSWCSTDSLARPWPSLLAARDATKTMPLLPRPGPGHDRIVAFRH